MLQNRYLARKHARGQTCHHWYIDISVPQESVWWQDTWWSHCHIATHADNREYRSEITVVHPPLYLAWIQPRASKIVVCACIIWGRGLSAQLWNHVREYVREKRLPLCGSVPVYIICLDTYCIHDCIQKKDVQRNPKPHVNLWYKSLLHYGILTPTSRSRPHRNIT